MANDCSCRRCVRENDPKSNRALDLFMRLHMVCDTCGDRECPHAEDHRSACRRGPALGVADQPKLAA